MKKNEDNPMQKLLKPLEETHASNLRYLRNTFQRALSLSTSEGGPMEEKDFLTLVNEVFLKERNPYSIFEGQVAQNASTVSGLVTLIPEMYHALMDDGEILFIIFEVPNITDPVIVFSDYEPAIQAIVRERTQGHGGSKVEYRTTWVVEEFIKNLHQVEKLHIARQLRLEEMHAKLDSRKSKR